MEMRNQLSLYMKENLEEISKVGKNYLHNKGQSASKYLELLYRKDYEVDEMFLVLIARRYKRHVCVLLENGGMWCTTQWIQMNNCEIVLLACINKVDNTRCFTATRELLREEGSTYWKQKHKKEASTQFEQEMEHFLKNVPEKVAIRSQIDGRKRSVFNVNTKFLNKKMKLSKPVSKSHLEHYKVKSTKISRPNEDGREVNQASVQTMTNESNGKKMSQPISKMLSLLHCLNDACNEIYKMKTIDLENIKNEIEGVKTISKGLTKYCLDIADII